MENNCSLHNPYLWAHAANPRASRLKRRGLMIPGKHLTEALTIITIAAILALIAKAIMGGVGLSLVVVEGRSMEPLLHRGDLVIVLSVPPDKIKVGDVIVYRGCLGRLIIHRVYAVCNADGVACYVTWGDNNKYPDPYWISCSSYMCKIKTERCPLGCRSENGYCICPCVPYDKVIGRVVEVSGSVYKIPYIGAITSLVKR